MKDHKEVDTGNFINLELRLLGFAGPEIDAEIILMCQRLWDDLGVTGLRLEINSLGDESERIQHREALIQYFNHRITELDEDSQRRLHTNPLRILDTKNPAMQELVEQAPRLINFLGSSSLDHFQQLQDILKANNIPFKINPRLVRGLDYYNLTVFEWITDQLGAQGTVAGGGRYDPLIAKMGGKAAPACGWAMGIERIMELMKEQDVIQPDPTQCDIYILHSGGKTLIPAMVGAEMMRSAGIDVIVHASNERKVSSFKSQMKRADGSGALFAVIIGENELETNSFLLKDLRKTGDQISFPMIELVDRVIDAIISQND
jgi:histidyl-tRNA synthetase